MSCIKLGSVPVRTRTPSVTQLRRLIALLCASQVSTGERGACGHALPHTLWEGWGPYCPCPPDLVTSETTTETKAASQGEVPLAFLAVFAEAVFVFSLLLFAWVLGAAWRAGVRGARAHVRCSASAGPQAWLLRSLWGLPESGIEPVSPAPTGGFFTTDPPGKP